MKNPEKVFIPLGIGAAVIGIWAALRRPATQIVQSAGPGLNIPALPALQTSEYAPPVEYGPPVPQPDTSTSTGTNPLYNGAAASSPLSLNLNEPAATLAPYSYLNYNLPPWTDLSKLLSGMGPNESLKRMLQSVPPGETFSACGEGCGCKHGGTSECNQTVNPIQPDGHGSCLSATPKVPLQQFNEQLNGLRYMAATPYDCARTGSQFDLNCLSLFVTQALDFVPISSYS